MNDVALRLYALGVLRTAVEVTEKSEKRAFEVPAIAIVHTIGRLLCTTGVEHVKVDETDGRVEMVYEIGEPEIKDRSDASATETTYPTTSVVVAVNVNVDALMLNAAGVVNEADVVTWKSEKKAFPVPRTVIVQIINTPR